MERAALQRGSANAHGIQHLARCSGSNKSNIVLLQRRGDAYAKHTAVALCQAKAFHIHSCINTTTFTTSICVAMAYVTQLICHVLL